ncbi:MAG TPA: hypothetical protein VJX10_13450, partial [Pseudonocardiaceae bacterium]|nr:hypothetical protein [Pseudonocardiaceae bacterium]
LRWVAPSGWSRWLPALPGAIVHDTAAALRLAARSDRREGDDEFRPVGVPGDRHARWAGRAAGTITVLSATPGSVVVADDAERNELLVHSLPIGRTRLEQEVRRR